MKPNLLVGDFLFVSKWDYGYSRYSFPFGLPLFDGKLLEKSPKRGDIIVFKLPTKESINYVKRLVAMPGEIIKISEGMIYVKKKGASDFKIYSQKKSDFSFLIFRNLYFLIKLNPTSGMVRIG